MSVARAKRLGWSLFAFTVAGIGVMVWLSAGREEAFDTILYGLLALIFSGAGALIVAKHPDNAIGWMFLYLGVSSVFWETAEGWGYFAAERGLPGGPIGRVDHPLVLDRRPHRLLACFSLFSRRTASLSPVASVALGDRGRFGPGMARASLQRWARLGVHQRRQPLSGWEGSRPTWSSIPVWSC